MKTKEYHIGKTVPEMIAVLEKYDERCRRVVDKLFLPDIVKIANETNTRYNQMSKDQQLANYKEIESIMQFLLRPAKNYEAMSYEELIKCYNSHRTDRDFVEFHAARRRAEKASAKKRLDWKRFQNMSNRVKTAVTGLFESVKKRVGKENKDF